MLSNHDETRHITRYELAHTGVTTPMRGQSRPCDRDLGTRRARALPGGAHIYQGEELSLYEVESIPEELLQDPTWERSGHTLRGRDGCRVPLPWTGDTPPFGFGPLGSTPWLPQPDDWKTYTAEANQADPASMFQLYRAALHLRKDHAELNSEELHWLDSPDGTRLFEHGKGLLCEINLLDRPPPLPNSCWLLLTSGPLEAGGLLPPDSAA
ncbi:DUF3459 domain-containing protein [Streptomyces sp. N50]|uniref:alpha-amylase family glycosyl hydrolase n=1 Tax=Streptomyces sp. N50 TaxID=3081765 RepID=UPI00296205E4|nr:DUF3459 domain-containing protein [Streptomyces sp. N50]WOX15312.1 hypothetical protein R2B38_43560 [Streptomyces sp. N50]